LVVHWHDEGVASSDLVMEQGYMPRLPRYADATQRWAVRYDRFTRQWPQSLRLLRPAIVWAFGNFRFLDDRMRIADRGLTATSVRLN